MSDNGVAPVVFTHKLKPFEVEGHVFHRQKVPARAWAELMAEVGVRERSEMDKEQGGVLMAVSADGLHELIGLAIRPEDRDTWDALYAQGHIEFGELLGLKDWLWEQMTERPFPSDTPSSDGPGSSSAPSSKDASLSQAEVLTG